MQNVERTLTPTMKYVVGSLFIPLQPTNSPYNRFYDIPGTVLPLGI